MAPLSQSRRSRKIAQVKNMRKKEKGNLSFARGKNQR
jgi:hypothetical protein